MKTFFTAFALFITVLFILALAAFFILVDTSPMGKTDYLLQTGRLTLFRYTGTGSLSDEEIRRLYEKACTKKCHSRDVVELSAHSAREWEETIERMRTVNGAGITKNEVGPITAYLAKRYGSNIPTILSAEGGQYLKKNLWRSDFGEADLYVDLIYTPPAYFRVVGGSSKVQGYDAGRYEIFTVYLNTHQDKLSPFPLDKLATLKTAGGESYTPIFWKVIYDSSDFHHREGLLVFKKLRKGEGEMTITLKDLPGQSERLFVWTLPIPENSVPEKK